VPDYAIVAGNPARLLRMRYPDAVLERIKDLEWWLWDDATLRKHRDLFEANLAEIELDELDRLLDQVP
jgi:virginiamycin A acetyltransferase